MRKCSAQVFQIQITIPLFRNKKNLKTWQNSHFVSKNILADRADWTFQQPVKENRPVKHETGLERNTKSNINLVTTSVYQTDCLMEIAPRCQRKAVINITTKVCTTLRPDLRWTRSSITSRSPNETQGF